LLRTSIESSPALSERVLGMTSRAFAKAFTTTYYLFEMVLAYARNSFESSNSMAPPPATIDLNFKALLTIIIASFNDLSAS